MVYLRKHCWQIYDTNEIIAYALNAGMDAIIPRMKNRKRPREYNMYLYKLHHLAENASLMLKRWYVISTRYIQPTDSLVAAV